MARFRAIRNKLQNSYHTYRSHRRMALLVMLCYVIVSAVVIYGLIPEQRSWEVGSVATRDLIADRSLTYEDEQATKARQDEALSHLDNIYTLNLERYNNFTLVDIDKRFADIANLLYDEASKGLSFDQKLQSLNALGLQVDDHVWYVWLQKPKDALQRLKEQTVLLSSDVMGAGVREEAMPEAHQRILQGIQNATALDAEDKVLASAVVQRVRYYPTSLYDAVATREAKVALLKTVDPIQHTIQRGQSIVNKGDIVTEAQYATMKALGYTTDSPLWVYVVGGLCMVALIFSGLYIGVYHLSQKREGLSFSQRYLMMVVIYAIIALTLPLVFSIELGSTRAMTLQAGFLVPVAAGAMMVCVLVGVVESLYVLTLLSLLPALYADSIAFFFVAFLGSLVAVTQTQKLNRRRDLAWVALSISATHIAAIASWGLASSQDAKVLAMGIVYGFTNGFLSVVFTVGILPYLETSFNVTTAMRLLELSDPNKPLLKRLMHEAPGTYYHSLMVANLAESIADHIGADGLLLRTAAYYHDIGKLKRPAFFTENQLSDENPHDQISPMLSTLIITSHVKDGVQMAKEAFLPQAVIDLIAQHHGNTVVGYFYMKALEADESVKEDDFRYHQRRPQSREAAILMIADTVEAAVRSRKNLNAGQIEGFIHQLIHKKERDGQFEECDLTFKDLKAIAAICTRVMCGIYHKRIEYPEKKELLRENRG